MDGVEGPADCGQDMVLADHGRMNPGLHGLAVASGQGQELDGVAELPGIGYVLGLDLGDPLHRKPLELERPAESQGDQNGQLMGRVNALDIQAGVGLGQAFGLGLGQDPVKGFPLLAHPGQDIIRGSVEDGRDGVDPAGGKPLPNGTDKGDSPAHRALEEQPRLVLLGQREDLVSMVGQKGLVGRDHLLARPQGLFGKGQGRLQAPD